MTIVVPALALHLGDGNMRDGYQPAMGLMGILGSILFLVCFFTTKERIKPVIEKTKFKEQAKLLLRNDQWLILCVVLVLVMCGIVIRGSVGAYYAKYYLHGGDALILSLIHI